MDCAGFPRLSFIFYLVLALCSLLSDAQELQRKVCPTVPSYVPRKKCGNPGHQCLKNDDCDPTLRCCPSAIDCSYTCVKPKPPRGCPIPIDLALLLDSSGSIGRRNWVKVRNFAKDVIDYYDVSDKGTHVGIVMYSSDASVQLPFDKYKGAALNNVNVKRDIDGLRLEKGLTFIDKALLLAANELFIEERGMRPERKKVALVLTDGIQTKDKGKYTPLEEASGPLKAKGVAVYALGIGLDIDLDELLSFATDDGYIFQATSFDALALQVKNITQAQCQACDQPVDIYLGIPSAKELRGEFEDIKQFFSRLTTLFQVEPRKSHIGVLRYSDTADMVLKLDEQYSRAGVSSFIEGMKPEGSGFNVRRALEAAADQAFTIFGGVRQTAPKTFVLFVPKELKESKEEIQAAATKLKNMGVRLIIVGLREKVDPHLGTISSQPKSRYFITAFDYDELGVAGYEIADTACKVRYGKCQAFRPPMPAECPPREEHDCDVDKDCSGEDEVCCAGGCGRICETKVDNCFVTMDIALAIDTASVSDEDISNVKTFTSNLVHSLSDSENAIRFGVMTYGENAKTLSNLKQFASESKIRATVDKLKPSAESTRRVDTALHTMTKEIFSLEGGMRQGHPRYAIFLTAGSTSADSEDLAKASDGLRKLGVNIMAVGLNSQSDSGFLNELATESRFAFPLASSGELASLWPNIQKQMCNPKPGSCPTVTASSCTPRGNRVSQNDIPCGTSAGHAGRSDKQNDWDCPGEQKCCLDSTGCNHICRDPPLKCEGQFDLALLIESTSSDGLGQVKDFAQQLVEAFTISQPKTHVAVISFAATPTRQLKLNSLRGPDLDASRVKSAIRGVQPTNDRASSTAAAMGMALNDVFTIGGGMRESANKSLVIISQGKLQDPSEAAAIAGQLRQKFVDVFAMPIGDNPDVAGLRKVVSKPVDKNVFMTTSYGALQPNLRALTRTICEGATKVRLCGIPLDITFGIPVSRYIGQAIWNIKSTFAAVLGLLKVSPLQVHVGLVPFSSDADLALHIDSIYNKEGVIKQMNALKPSTDSGYDLLKPLQVAADRAFTLFGGVRQTVPKVFVLFVTGKGSSDLKAVQDAATKLKSLGVRILVVGLTNQVDQSLAKTIASQPSSKYVRTADSYSGLAAQAPMIVDTICGARYGKSLPLPPPPGGVCPPEPSLNCSLDASCVSQGHLCSFDECGSSTCTEGIRNCFVPAEIAFAFDASESTSTQAFQDMKTFAMDMIRPFASSENNLHIGILKYSSIANTETQGFRKFRSERELHAMLKNMEKTSDPVKRVDLALRTANRDFFSAKGGRRFGHPKYLIFLTSAPSTAGYEGLAEASADLRKAGVNIIAVGANNAIEPTFLQDLATDPKFVFSSESSAGLQGIVGDVSGLLCHDKPGKCPTVLDSDPGACASQPQPPADMIPCGRSMAGKESQSDRENDWDCPGEAKCCLEPNNGCHHVCVPPPLVCKERKDLLFMVESSEKLGESGFKKVKTFTKQIVDAFDISPLVTKVAFMSFNQRSSINFGFNALKGNRLNKKNVFDRIDNVRYSGGRYARTYQALRSARTKVFDERQGSRPVQQTNKTVVLFTTGRFDDPQQVTEEAWDLRGELVDVFVVPVGKDPDVDSIRAIVSHPIEDNIFMMTSAGALKPQLRGLVDTICRGEVLCYDDACHLKKYAQNPERASQSATAEEMSSMDMAVDRFHFPNHVDAWCKRNCNTNTTTKLQGVNTEVCEQLFSWLSKCRFITKHMSRYRFFMLMLHLLDSHNEDIEHNLEY